MKRDWFDWIIDGFIVAGILGVVAMFMFIHWLGGWEVLI